MTLHEMVAKRSKLIADRKAVVDKAVAEGRGLTAEESNAVDASAAECAAIERVASASSAIAAEQARAVQAASAAAVSREDTGENPLEMDFDGKTLDKYSIVRAMRLRANNKPIDGFEGEVSAHIAKKFGKQPKGFYVPTRVLHDPGRHRAAAITTTTGTGAILTTVTGNYIDALRALTVVGRAGATYMGGLQGTFGIPASGNISTYWVTEGNAPTAGAGSFTQVVLSPKTAAAYQDFTRQFMEETSVDVENFARETLIKQLAVAIDTAVIQGTGASGQPLGILNNTNCSYLTLPTGVTGVGTVGLSTATGSTISWANAVALETVVATANVAIDSGAYICSPSLNGSMKTNPKATNYPAYISQDGEVNGYPVLSSNIAPNTNGTNNSASALVFGNWSDCIIGQWGALDLFVDPYSLSNSGGIRVVAFQDVDVELRHSLSFARGYDGK